MVMLAHVRVSVKLQDGYVFVFFGNGLEYALSNGVFSTQDNGEFAISQNLSRDFCQQSQALLGVFR